MGSNMSDQKNTEEESGYDEMKWKAANVKEKVNEGVDEAIKVIKAAKGEIDEEDKALVARLWSSSPWAALLVPASLLPR